MYRSVSRLVRRSPATGRYRRLGLFPPRYHPKSDRRPTVIGHCRAATVDFDRRRPILGSINRGRKKKRENLESGAALPILIHHPRVTSSR
ncbi:hypothetical protein BHM03_00033116, partial [Ensete ventricosum]